MPDKVVTLWKVLGEVSETVDLDPPNTSKTRRAKVQKAFIPWRFRVPVPLAMRE